MNHHNGSVDNRVEENEKIDTLFVEAKKEMNSKNPWNNTKELITVLRARLLRTFGTKYPGAYVDMEGIINEKMGTFLSGIEQVNNPYTYLYTLVKNRCTDELRKQKGHSEIETKNHHDICRIMGINIESDPHNKVTLERKREKIRLVHNALNILESRHPQQAQIIERRLLDGVNNDTVAREFWLTNDKASEIFESAKTKLRKILRKLMENDNT